MPTCDFMIEKRRLTLVIDIVVGIPLVFNIINILRQFMDELL